MSRIEIYENGRLIYGEDGIIAKENANNLGALVQVIEGDHAVTLHLWLSAFNRLEDGSRSLIKAIFPDIETQVAQTTRKIKSPDKLLRIAYSFCLNNEKLRATCSRCDGSGEYSYHPLHGTMCFKCRGSGWQLPRITKKYLELVKAEFEAHKQAKQSA